MSSAADMFAQSIVDMVRAEKEAKQAVHNLEVTQQALDELLARAIEAEETNAANLAEKYALRQQLARYAPDHPLLKNLNLLEKIRDLGTRAFSINRNYNDARKVGETYFPPGTPPISKK